MSNMFFFYFFIYHRVKWWHTTLNSDTVEGKVEKAKPIRIVYQIFFSKNWISNLELVDNTNANFKNLIMLRDKLLNISWQMFSFMPFLLIKSLSKLSCRYPHKIFLNVTFLRSNFGIQIFIHLQFNCFLNVMWASKIVKI